MTATSSIRLTIVYASDIENEAGKEKRGWDEKRNKNRKKKRIELNVIRMNSQYITKKKKEN
jgi:hypothetical protein